MLLSRGDPSFGGDSRSLADKLWLNHKVIFIGIRFMSLVESRFGEGRVAAQLVDAERRRPRLKRSFSYS